MRDTKAISGYSQKYLKRRIICDRMAKRATSRTILYYNIRTGHLTCCTELRIDTRHMNA